MKKPPSFEKEIKTIGLISKTKISGHEKTIKQLVRFCKRHKKKVVFDTNVAKLFKKEKGFNKKNLLSMVDFAIILGGDGTLLKTARSIGRNKVLTLGVNFGTLGFLTECTPDKLSFCLNKIISGQYNVDRRSILRTTIYRKGKKMQTFASLNDAVINQGSFARLIKLDMEIDHRKMTTMHADGVIVATPSGSSGHSLSAGGPIIHPKIESLVVTPICPSSLSMRPIVIPDDRILSIKVDTRRKEDSAKIGLTIDGQEYVELKYGDIIKFRRSKRYFYLARTGNRYYKMLRNKLGWGG